MTKDDILSLMKETGELTRTPFDEWCLRFANRVYAFAAAAEREECAKLCEKIGDQDCGNHAWDATYAIRARGNT